MKKQIVVWGKVQKGSKRGKLLGFPTVNIRLHKKIPEGVYIAEVKIDKQIFDSLTFVGAAKTFDEKKKKVESYILKFNKNLYGKWISVKLIKKLRGNIKFKSEKELIKQIKRDLFIAKRLSIYSNFR